MLSKTLNKSENISKGIKGEIIALQYLEAKGYEFLEANYHSIGGEIDLIVRIGEVVIFVEVKLRKNSDYGLPEEAVSKQKIKKITKVALDWLENNQWKGEIRFDIVSILRFPKKGEDAIFHIEDAFIGLMDD